MRTLLATALASTLVLSSAALAAEPAVKERLIVQGNVVELVDGSKITIDKDGRTYHESAAGKRVRMKDDVVMQGKDGRKYLHKNDVTWAQITEKGTLAPNR